MAKKINMSNHYDEDADILYIDFGSNEPCFTEDVEGFLMVDIGWFSKLPRGIRIISPKARNVRSINFVIAKAEKKLQTLMERRVNQIQESESILQTAISAGLSQAFAGVN